jgi:hypothetical protein
MKAYRGSKRSVPSTLNLSAKQLIGRHTYRLLCPRERVPVQLNMGLSGPQSHSERLGEEKLLYRRRNNNIRTVGICTLHMTWSKSVTFPNFRKKVSFFFKNGSISELLVLALVY